MWLQFFDLVLCQTDIGKLSIQQNPREPGAFPDGIIGPNCIGWSQNVNLKALSFFQLLKLEKMMWLQFFDLVLCYTDIGTLSIHQNPREPGTFPDGIIGPICIGWSQNVNLKALSFFQLLKLEKMLWLQFFDLVLCYTDIVTLTNHQVLQEPGAFGDLGN